MTAVPSDFFERPLADVDPEIAEVLQLELERQQRTLEMIASENFVPTSILECHGSVLTNKYAEGLPGKRYYGGCEYVDMDEVARLAQEHRPKMILAGWSAYPRHLDFALFREIADDVGAYLLTDMAHFAGLVAGGVHPNPVPHSHVVTTTVHKTLGGARGGMILSNDEELAKKLNSATFPGQQGGPLEHVIAGKAVALRIAQTDAFKERQQRTIDGAQALAEELLQAGHGVSVLTKGTDVHLILVDLRRFADAGNWRVVREGAVPAGEIADLLG